MEARPYPNPTEDRPEKVASDRDHPHRFVIGGIGELPSRVTEKWSARFRSGSYDALHSPFANANLTPISTALGILTAEKGHGQRQPTFAVGLLLQAGSTAGNPKAGPRMSARCKSGTDGNAVLRPDGVKFLDAIHVDQELVARRRGLGLFALRDRARQGVDDIHRPNAPRID